MHVLYICHEYPPVVAGGIGSAVATLARGMAKAGHRVSVLGFYPQAAVEEDHGVSVYRHPYPRSVRFVSWWIARRKLRSLIAELHAREPIDVVEWPDFHGWFWEPVDGIVDVVKVHGTAMSHRIHGLAKRRRVNEWLELRTLRSLRNWVGVSKWFNDEWRAIADVKLDREAIVYNPVNVDLFRPPTLPREPGMVLYAGGLKRRKGVLSLARAAAIFLREVPGSRLVMLGFPSDLTTDDVRREAGPMADRIEFIPFLQQREFAPIMAKASVYAMPSLYESCGNTWIEAMSCETPTVGSTLSCGPEIVEDGKTGLLSDPGNPADIADKIVRLLRHPDLAREMGRAGRARAIERFSLDVAVATSARFYEDVRAERL